MSILDGDGTGDPSYGEALCALVALPNDDAKQRAILRAIQREHGLLPPDPEPTPGTPAFELAELRKEREALAAERAALAAPVTNPAGPVQTESAEADENAALRARVAELEASATGAHPAPAGPDR